MESYSCVSHLYLCCHSNRFLTLIPLSLVVFGKSISACGIVTLCVFGSIAACLAFGFLCCCIWSPSTYHQPVGGPFRNSLKHSGWKLAESKMVTQCYTLTSLFHSSKCHLKYCQKLQWQDVLLWRSICSYPPGLFPCLSVLSLALSLSALFLRNLLILTYSFVII